MLGKAEEIMQIFQNIILFLFFMAIQTSVHAFGLWQCAGMLLSELNPMYWNVSGLELKTEVFYLKRKDNSENIDIASKGVYGPIVLKTDDVDKGWEGGYSLTGQINLQEGKIIELIWQNTCDFHDSAKASSPAEELYSLFSQFGQLPLGGFEDTDGTSLQTIAFESKINSIELNIKKQWPLLRGDFLYGYRKQSIDENFKYNTQSEAKWYRSNTETKNDMNGFQVGFEAFIPCTEVIKIQMFAKGAIYINFSERKYKAISPAFIYPLAKKKSETIKAWGVDAGVDLIYQWCRNVNVSLGYKYLSFDNVALAVKNFDEIPPFEGYEKQRKNSINNHANLSFHGVALGASLIW